MTLASVLKEFHRTASELTTTRQNLISEIDNRLHVAEEVPYDYLSHVLFLIDVVKEAGKIQKTHSRAALLMQRSAAYRNTRQPIDEVIRLLKRERNKVMRRKEILKGDDFNLFFGAKAITKSQKIRMEQQIIKMRYELRNLKITSKMLIDRFSSAAFAFREASTFLPVTISEFHNKSDAFTAELNKFSRLKQWRERRALALKTFPGLKVYVPQD